MGAADPKGPPRGVRPRGATLRWPTIFKDVWGRIRAEPVILVALLLVAGAIWVFVELAGDVIEGDTHAFDRAILLSLRSAADPSDPIGPLWVEEMARDITSLGGTAVLTFITVAAVIYLLLIRMHGAAVLVIASVGGGMLLSTALKLAFDRTRPDLVPHAVHVYTASFPSGHAMLSAVTYLTLGALLARMQPDRRVKAYLLLVAVLVTLFVGISRIYLGVHWPTDVLAGWCLGAAWAMLCWLAALWLQRRGQVEQAGIAGGAEG
jgi:undecaprenyl-diphosphatase